MSISQEIRRKSLEELEVEFADVMGNKVVTDVTRYSPKNEGSIFDEVEVKCMSAKFAPEMREVMYTMFGGSQ